MTMAETVIDTDTGSATQDKTNNNRPLKINQNHKYLSKHRKRKRLNQVVDKLSSPSLTVDYEDVKKTKNNNVQTFFNYNVINDSSEKVVSSENNVSPQIFTFDHSPKEYLLNSDNNSGLSEDEDVLSFTSSSNKSPRSITDSPQINCCSLRLKEKDICSSPPLALHQPSGCSCAKCISTVLNCLPPINAFSRFFPAVPVPSFATSILNPLENYILPKYFPKISEKQKDSESDIPFWLDIQKNNSTLLPQTREISNMLLSPQEVPLDLSMKTPAETNESSLISLRHTNYADVSPPLKGVSIHVVKGDVASSTTKVSVACRYNLEVSPVVEEMPPGSDVAYVCPVCGQMFSLHDRLAKHMASRHKSRQTVGETATKAYLCEVCKRSFARSDMLTRHMRLHTGIKPYTCRVCGQVFSRSDHLSTHQRTHTGEKPYKCPQCPYAACRRDMITRHMRTHARYEPDAVLSKTETD